MHVSNPEYIRKYLRMLREFNIRYEGKVDVLQQGG